MKKIFYAILFILLLGCIIPENFTIPVKGASKADYNQDSFWFYPWGKSVTHKGVDIFAKNGTPVYSSTKGIVVYTGSISAGGNIVLVLGPKWRFHYYAHLNTINTNSFSFVNNGSTIGTVGDSGNAKGKAPHLHYAIKSLLPYPWKIDKSPQGWKKMFYINPIPYLNKEL